MAADAYSHFVAADAGHAVVVVAVVVAEWADVAVREAAAWPETWVQQVMAADSVDAAGEQLAAA